MTTRIAFDSSSSSFIDREDLAFSAPTVEHPHTPMARVYGGAIRHTTGQDKATTIAHGRHSEPIAGTAGASIVSTLQGRYGPSESVELQPGNPASRTSVDSAVNLGLIRKDEAGNWVDAATDGAPTPAEADRDQEEQGAADAEVFDADAFRAYADAIAPLPQTAFDVAQAHAMAGVFEGQTLSQVAAEVGHRLATESGIGLEPSRAAEVVRQGVQYHESTVARVAAQEGIDASMKDAFYESLRKGNQAGLQDALGKLLYQGDPSGFRALAKAYAVATPSPEARALQEAGWEVSRTADGWVTRPANSTGNWVPVAELVRHGAAGTPAAPVPPKAPTAPSKAPAGKTKLWFNPATGEMDLTEAEAIRDGVNMKHFAWL